MSDKLGIQATEGTANVLTLNTNVPVRSIGLLMSRERGVPNKISYIPSAKEDVKIFGSHDKTRHYSSYVVKNLFDNLAGSNIELYGIRIVGTGTVVAEATVQNDTPANVLIVKAGREGLEDPGDWGNNLKFKISPPGVDVIDKYYGEVLYFDESVETFTADTLSKLADKINAQSAYVVIEEVDYSLGLGVAAVTATLAGGVFVAPVEADFEPDYNAVTLLPEGLALFEGAKVNIISCTEIFTDAYAAKAETFCAAQKLFYVHNYAEDVNEAAIIASYNALKKAQQAYIACYINWCEVDDGDEGKLWIPALGYWIGAGYVRVSALDNDVVWSVPAGDRTYSAGIYQFSHQEYTEQMITRYATQYFANAVLYVNNVGNIIWSQRTMSLNFLYQSVHVRLETSWIIKVLLERHVPFKDRLITPKLNNDMLVDNTMWFQNIYNQGGIEASIPFSQAVIIDVATSKTNRRQTMIDISWIPPENNEYIKLTLNRNDGALSVIE